MANPWAALRVLAVTLALGAAMTAGLSAGNGFLQGWSLPEGSDSHSVALGDLDGDGDVDAYVTEFYAPDTLWLNDGAGQFARSPQVLDAGYGSCVLLGTLDNNSSLDLFIGRHLATNRVWFNDGLGTFTDSNQSVGSTFSRRGGAVGDVDGDLDLDVYMPTDSSGSPNELYLNNGSGVFTASGQVLGSYASRAVALGNVDNDGDLDAMIGNNGANKLWKNNGAGVFTDSGQTVGTRGTFDVELGDLDGDSDLDVWFANGSTSGDPDEVWINDGLGNFSNSGQLIGNDFSFSVVLFKCDADNDLDAFVGNNTGQPNRLYLNNGAGVFSDSGQALGIGGAISVAASDLDGDLDIDLFLANNTQPEQVFLNDGLCQFASNGQLLGSSSAEAVALGDIDGDGDRDALVGSYGGITRVFRNDGLGAFTDDDQWMGGGFGTTVTAVRLADFDGDHDLDAWIGLALAALVGNDDPGDRLWLNDGTGSFTDSGQLLGSEYTMDAAVGDVDGDLDLDIVAANYTSAFSAGTNRLYRNNGTGTFTQDRSRWARVLIGRWPSAGSTATPISTCSSASPGARARSGRTTAAVSSPRARNPWAARTPMPWRWAISTVTATSTPFSATAAATRSGSTTAAACSPTRGSSWGRPTRLPCTCSTPMATVTWTPGPRTATALRNLRRSG